MARFRKRKSLIWTCAFAVVVILLIGVSLFMLLRPSNDQRLKALASDPLAATTWQGATVVIRQDTARDSGGLIFSSKPKSTQVLRGLAPIDQSLPDLYQQVLAAASASGWTVSDAGTSATAVKSFDFGAAKAEISTNTYSSPATVTIVLSPTTP